MTYIPPCAEPAADPDDWFISRDGKQYGDDIVLTAAEARMVTRSVLPTAGEQPEEHEARVASALRAAVASRKTKALGRRRRAKEACLSCAIRPECLEKAIEEGFTHGTWGGLYEEEVATLRVEIERRRRPRMLR